MALNKKSLGPSILSLNKGKNEAIQAMHLKGFAKLENASTSDEMICFTTEETPDTYYWASSGLYNFLNDNIENADFDSDSLTYSFPEDEVIITHLGKVQLKSDKNKSCNKWKIEC